MSRSFGHAAGRGALAAAPHDLSTTEGMVRHSKQHGAMGTLGAIGECGSKPNAPRQDVALVTAPDGSQYVRHTRDVARDPRTMKQQTADEWIKRAGINTPLPRPR